MKKRFIFATVTIVIIAAMATVYGGNALIGNKEVLNNQNEIERALQTKDLNVYFADEESNNTMNASTYALRGSSVEYETDKSVQCVSIADVKNKDSLIDCEGVANSVLVPIVQDDVTVGIATLKEGISVSKAAKILNKKGFSEADKSSVLADVTENEGKPYVSSIYKIAADFDDAALFFNHDSLVDLAKNTISADITDEKYMRIVRDNMYVYVFKAAEQEYVIPYDLSINKELENGKVYEFEDVKDILTVNY